MNSILIQIILVATIVLGQASNPSCSNPIKTYKSGQTCQSFIITHPAFNLSYLQKYCVCPSLNSVLPFPASFCAPYDTVNQVFLSCSPTKTVTTITTTRTSTSISTSTSTSTETTTSSEQNSSDENIRVILGIVGAILLLPILICCYRCCFGKKYQPPSPQFNHRKLNSIIEVNGSSSSQDSFYNFAKSFDSPRSMQSPSIVPSNLSSRPSFLRNNQFQ
ncbi:hypothetical protein BC833DRAFT_600399 [Globomyces pollinis-pini]|nr:hypothetical protein BC833DRAFT_600399 [Globomyces pollinis-pini]